MNAKKQIIDASVEQKTIYEEDDCLHCGLCSFSSKSKMNIMMIRLDTILEQRKCE